MFKRRNLKVLLIALSVIITVYLVWALYVRYSTPPVTANTLVGLTESQICTSYGQPKNDDAGYRQLGFHEPEKLPSGSIRTLVFRPNFLLHPEGGTLWVWLVLRDGIWVCFESCWYADGVMF
jgi:hypothetical protein